MLRGFQGVTMSSSRTVTRRALSATLASHCALRLFHRPWWVMRWGGQIRWQVINLATVVGVVAVTSRDSVTVLMVALCLQYLVVYAPKRICEP